MNVSHILLLLERERQLLQEFRILCEQQLVLLNVEDMASVNSLLDQRADLVLEMSAIEATLGTWIDQISAAQAVSDETIRELVSVNEEIVALAKMVVEIDEETHWRLEFIKTYSADELRAPSVGTNPLNGYSRSVGLTNSSSLEYLS